MRIEKYVLYMTMLVVVSMNMLSQCFSTEVIVKVFSCHYM